MLTLKNKIVVHIPHKAFIDEKFVDIDYLACRNNLIQMLESCGVGGFYITNVVGHYKNRSYDEELLTFFYNKTNDDIENKIYSWIESDARVLKQECIAVEFDGILKII